MKTIYIFGHIQFYDYVSISTIKKYLVESLILTHIILHFKKV